MTRKVIPIIPAESLIPRGPYCYEPLSAPAADNGWVFKIKCCPFWSCSDGEGGYCAYLKTGDGRENGTNLLWDQIKACDVKRDFPEAESPDPWVPLLA